ncbi:MAG TPA: F0F1 ATP synthase subunit gamma [Peptococcaceae bacterium]|nr:F0F1 ATP synthase subunit gamma [Peptococcaceae bacterium]
MRQLRRRIRAVKSTQQICRAMKAVATAKMAKAQERVVAARPYSQYIREVLGRLAAAAGDARHPLLDVREPQKVCYVVITADRGLCGAFNANILRRSLAEVQKWPDVSIVAVGRKGRDFFRFRGWRIAQQYVRLGEDIHIGHSRDIARYLIDQYTAGEFDRVYLVYSQFINVLVQKPSVIQLLPVEPPAEGEGKEKFRTQYIFEPSPEAVLADLLPRYVESLVYHCLIESKASEHSARMTAMDAATKNAGEMMDRLTLKMNRIRQESITSELLDIVGGAAALE